MRIQVYREVRVPIFFLFLFLLQTFQSQAQLVLNPDYEKILEEMYEKTVPFISCEELKEVYSETLMLDTRSKKEYKISHIPGAKHAGFINFKESCVEGIEKDALIVVYCSVGYRSERIGEKLAGMGFTNVKNLYGSLFEWVNRGLPLEDAEGQSTKRVHTYNRDWGQWVQNSDYVKVN